MNIALVGAEATALLASLHAESFTAPWSQAEFDRLLALPPAFALLARADAPVGFVLAWTPADEAEILTIAVAPPARRKGVAAALMAAAAGVASARGAHAMLLDVAEDNAAARALYAGLGFREAARRPAYYARAAAAPADALILRRGLPL